MSLIQSKFIQNSLPPVIVDRTSHQTTRAKVKDGSLRQKHTCAKGGRAYTYIVRDVVTGVRSELQVADGTIRQRKPICDEGLGYSTKEEVTATWLAHKT